MLPRTILRTSRLCNRCVPARLIPHTVKGIALCPLQSQSQTQPRRSGLIAQRRTYATDKSMADERIEEIQEQYATAKDEFEIAVEETEKKTVYAADDRAAAADELAKLKELYEAALKDTPADVAKEIQSRVGQRIRELDHAIQGLEKSAMED